MRLADRKHEVTLLRRMLRGQQASRILLIEAPSECGKSLLLSEFAACAEELLGTGCCARLDFKNGLALAAFFSRLYTNLAAGGFASSSRPRGDPSVQVQVSADVSGARFRDENAVTVQPIINLGTGDSAQHQGTKLIEDLRCHAKPVLLIIDTFEDATEEASKWVLQHLLPAVRISAHLQIVLAGQRVPDPGDYLLEWGELAQHHPLTPVMSASDWYEYACSKHPAFPRDYIDIVCMGLAHRPSAIKTYIETIASGLPSPLDAPSPL